MSSPLTPQDWATAHRQDDGEQQPISLLERMFGLEAQTKRYGLEVMRPLAALFEHPELSFPTIHVAGSKGKGSTVAMISSMLRSSGYSVATYVSPSLTSFGERICVDGQHISDSEMERLAVQIQRVSEELGEAPKFFEAATLAAFLHFRNRNVDIAVIEVGIGGLRDATNIVHPEVSVITALELEHTSILGGTIELIAKEKSGVIKPGRPVISGVTLPEARRVVSQSAYENTASLYEIDVDFEVEVQELNPRGQTITMRMNPGLRISTLEDVYLSLAGRAQSRNALLATATVGLLSDKFSQITEETVRSGLGTVRWPGRLEMVSEDPVIILDIAHTPSSAEQLRDYMDRFYSDAANRTLVCGMLREKDANRLARILSPAFDSIRVAPVKWFRTMSRADLRAGFLNHHSMVISHDSINEALLAAIERHSGDGVIVVAGSAFAVGEAKRGFDF